MLLSTLLPQAEAIIHLEAKLNKFSKKTTTENSKMVCVSKAANSC